MISRLEVVDDALKIGLGAIIGVVGTLIGTLISNRHQTREELRNRRWDAIQKCTVEFEIATQVFNRLHAHYLVYRQPHNQSDYQSRAEKWATAYGILNIEVGAAIQSMQGLESMLVVLGAEESSNQIALFRNRALALQSAVLVTDSDSPAPPSVEDFKALWQKGLFAKIQALKALQNDFRSS
jgi:hypothetical protein